MDKCGQACLFTQKFSQIAEDSRVFDRFSVVESKIEWKVKAFKTKQNRNGVFVAVTLFTYQRLVFFHRQYL